MLKDQPGALQLITDWLEQGNDQAAVCLDAHGIVIGWLAGAEEILGYAPEEAIGRHIALIFNDEDRAKGLPDYEIKVAASDNFAENSRWHVRKDGTRIWVSGTMSAVRGADGEIAGFVKLMRDQTDQRAHLERFENEVAELGDARQKTHLFLKTLGHEIRNPLGVLGNTHMILQRLAGDDRTRKAVDHLGSQISLLRRLADDLMDVSRLELGKVELTRERIDLREMLRNAEHDFLEPARNKNITLKTLFPPAELPVEVDRARIMQVILNLLNNAIKYTPRGGTVWLQGTVEGDEAVCRVQDTGIGIYPPVLPQIFELFSQAPEARDMSGGGIGVGLALVRQLVELHGGTVQARSSGLGKGAEFLFRLPLAKS
jgi:PAS domain S-box-containing protein